MAEILPARKVVICPHAFPFQSQSRIRLQVVKYLASLR